MRRRRRSSHWLEDSGADGLTWGAHGRELVLRNVMVVGVARARDAGAEVLCGLCLGAHTLDVAPCVCSRGKV